jgi:hypothetical protein
MQVGSVGSRGDTQYPQTVTPEFAGVDGRGKEKPSLAIGEEGFSDPANSP